MVLFFSKPEKNIIVWLHADEKIMEFNDKKNEIFAPPQAFIIALILSGMDSSYSKQYFLLKRF